MNLDKDYWIDKNGNKLYFEEMSLPHLRNIIKLIERQCDCPERYYTYNLALKIYNHREKLIPIPIYSKPYTIGYSKCGKEYIYKEFSNDYKYDEIIENEIEKRYLFDTTIKIGGFK